MEKHNQDEEVVLSHPEKVLFPDDNITKEDLADYYHKVAKAMLPYVKHRPIVVVRCPAGIETSCFFQKHPGESIPDLPTIILKEKSKKSEYGLVENEDDLIRLVQANVLEIHTWNCDADEPDHPDQFVLDLDPGPGVSFAESVKAANLVRRFVEQLGLQTFPRVTGGKGIHLVAPLKPIHTWDAVKDFTHQISMTLEREFPKSFLSKSRKEIRKGKIYVDYLRNGRGATAITNFSTRARPGATVAVPLSWNELKPALDPQRFTTRTVPARLKKLKADPWSEFFKVKQALPKVKF